MDEGVTYSMRGKEEAHDYRYFPEPDLVPLIVDEAWEEQMRKELPELPVQKMERFLSEYGLPRYDVEILTGDRALAAYFEETVSTLSRAEDGKQLDHERAFEGIEEQQRLAVGRLPCGRRISPSC